MPPTNICDRKEKQKKDFHKSAIYIRKNGKINNRLRQIFAIQHQVLALIVPNEKTYVREERERERKERNTFSSHASALSRSASTLSVANVD
jgi:hypothetical protein